MSAQTEAVGTPQSVAATATSAGTDSREHRTLPDGRRPPATATDASAPYGIPAGMSPSSRPIPDVQANIGPRSKDRAAEVSSVAVDDPHQRAERVFQRLVRARPEMHGSRRLRLVSDPQPRISARPNSEIIISTGLLEHCPTEDQLAAVLALALAERSARTPPVSSEISPREPLDLRIGPESSTYGELMPWRQAELVKTGQAHRLSFAAQPIEPTSWARTTCQRAGFSVVEFEQAQEIYYRYRQN
ncbi:MAG: hypothetical protein RMJ19_07850 [Gemmatales bacterium]|nr:hypothetical protein [Gemmatales bacterium]MDW8175569.1 hypothetical protein [Gemmatales bacterium]